MASTDVIQTVICLYLIRLSAVSWRPNEMKNALHNVESFSNKISKEAINTTAVIKDKFLPGYIVKLGLITLLVYMSAFLIGPFFAVYWQSVS